MSGQPDFDDPCWDDVSKEAKKVIRRLLEPDPSRRMTVEQLLQDPWLTRAVSSDPLLRTEKLNKFKQSTASLRAAAFAEIVQQQARSSKPKNERDVKKMARRESLGSSMF